MLEVQKLYAGMHLGHWAETHTTFLGELDALGIDVRDYPDHKMWLLDYNQINAVKNHPVVNECRGLLMSYDGEIVRKGFGRFYNLGENGIDTFDAENCVMFEKADGSLMFVYHCLQTGRWEIGTRGTAFAEGPNEWHGTFRNFMLFAMGRTEAEFQADCAFLDKRNTYLFEAVGPDNRIVTKYETNHLVELCNVETATGKEKFIDIVSDEEISFFKLNFNWNVRPVRYYFFNTQEDCMAALLELKGLEEGYVVYNKLTGFRQKMKSPVYLAAHRLRGQNGLTLNSICELVAMNEQAEYIAVFPEDAPKFEPALAEFGVMIDELVTRYNEHKNIETQKDFALTVKDMPQAGVMFTARKNGTSALEEFNKVLVGKKADWLKERLLATKQYKAVLVSEGQLDARCV
jgi:hypothetical protein